MPLTYIDSLRPAGRIRRQYMERDWVAGRRAEFSKISFQGELFSAERLPYELMRLHSLKVQTPPVFSQNVLASEAATGT